MAHIFVRTSFLFLVCLSLVELDKIEVKDNLENSVEENESADQLTVNGKETDNGAIKEGDEGVTDVSDDARGSEVTEEKMEVVAEKKVEEEVEVASEDRQFIIRDATTESIKEMGGGEETGEEEKSSEKDKSGEGEEMGDDGLFADFPEAFDVGELKMEKVHEVVEKISGKVKVTKVVYKKDQDGKVGGCFCKI